MEGHQYVFGMHQDTKNVHVHIAVNRVNPDTFRAIYPDRDFYELDRAMRELELRFGWRHDKGPFSVLERNGKKVVDWSRAAPDTKGAMPTAAADMERHADRESFFAYVRGEVRVDVVAALKDERLTWQKLHFLLAKHGVALREKGQGFAIYDTSDGASTPIKASDLHEELSKARLIKRLGAFEPASEVPEPDEHYDKFQEPARGNQRRDERKQARAEARRDLWARFLRYKAELVLPRFDASGAKARFLALRNEVRRRRSEVGAMTNRAQRKAIYSVIAFETARERERLKQRIQSERSDLRKEVRAQRLSFSEWVERQAATGDAAAISQLRGWSYAAKRKGHEASEQLAGMNAIKCASPADPSADLDLAGSHYRVRRDGSVRYSFDQMADGFIDRGSVIEIPGANIDRMALIAVLIFARRKYGDAFEVFGSAEFKSGLSELAAAFPDDRSLAEVWHQAALDYMAKRDTLRSVKPRASLAP